jgi:diguanylate cyclase
MSVVRSAWKMTVLAGFGAVVGYFLMPGELARDIAYSAIGLASVTCVVVGIRRRHPADPRAWCAIGAGILAFVVGDGVYDLYHFVLHQSAPFPSIADAFYLSGYPFLIVGVARLTRGKGRQGAVREGYADAGIVAIGALALSWQFLIGAYAHDSSMGVFGRFVAMSYPILDLAVLFIVIQGLVFGTVRRSVHTLLAAAMLAMIIGDFVYDLMVLHGTYVVGGAVDAGWLISYVLIGAAALHPAMAGAPVGLAADVTRRLDDSRRQLPLVASAGFVSPTILVIAAVVGRPADVAALALMSIALFGMVMVRMHWMLDRIRTQTHSLKQSLVVRDSLETELRHQAFHDSLTGLPNRALLHDRVEHALLGAPRSGATVAVCFCDLDGFKTVNDTLGHQGGDAMLIAAGKRLADIIRPGDTVARLGGDEFAVLMTSVDDPAAAAVIRSSSQATTSPCRSVSVSRWRALLPPASCSSAKPIRPCTSPRRRVRTDLLSSRSPCTLASSSACR